MEGELGPTPLGVGMDPHFSRISSQKFCLRNE